MKIFHYCPSCAAAVSGHGERFFVCDKCGFTLFFNVAASASVIVCSRGEVLLLKRANDPGKGLYTVPGGFVDPGESALACACRELYEECGIHLEQSALSFLCCGHNRYSYKGLSYHTSDIFFCAEVSDLSCLVSCAEVSSVSCVHKDRIDYSSIAFNSVREALRVFSRR